MQAQSNGWVDARQIEAARRAITGTLRRGGKVWIRVFPDKPVSKKPIETRMGKGKGNVEEWVAVVRRGRMLFEIAGVSRGRGARGLPACAPQALREDEGDLALGGLLMASPETTELRERTADQLREDMEEAHQALFNLRFQAATRQLADVSQVGKARRRIARIKTLLGERDIIAEADRLAASEAAVGDDAADASAEANDGE